MSPAEFVRRMGFPPECADLFSKYWSDAPEMELLPECFLTGFFERYAEKLAVPTPFAPEIPELSARVAAEKLLRFYANLILRAAYEFPHADLGGWPAPEQFLTPRQCGLFQLLLALAALPRIEGAYRELGLPPEYAAGPARWIGGTIAIYAAAHDGNPGHDLRQIHWLKCYMEKRLFRVGRFEFMIQGAPEWLPAIYRSRETGRTIAFCRTGWQLDRSGFRVRRGATGEYTARFDELANRVTGIPIDPATGRAEVHRTETIDTGEYAPVLSAHDWVPGIHIPGGGGMTPEATKASLVQAVEFFRTFFRREIRAFCCESWILNPDWLTELPGSHLARFMEELYLTPVPECDRAGLFFVFGRDDGDPASYPADNSLRRAFRRLIDAGRPLRAGGMFLLTADLERFGTGSGRPRRADGDTVSSVNSGHRCIAGIRAETGENVSGIRWRS